MAVDDSISLMQRVVGVTVVVGSCADEEESVLGVYA